MLGMALSDHPETNSFALQLNCSHIYYQNVTLNVTLMHTSTNVTSSIVGSCRNESLLDDLVLKCNNNYNLSVFWISDSGLTVLSPCLISHASLHQPCAATGKYVKLL